MFDPALLLLILASICIGFLLGRRRLSGAKRGNLLTREQFSHEYFVGLNYLLNEQTDEAIDTFIKALELSSDNVETYIVIGRLFRRRGETDKAIQAHQDILARPSLTREQSFRVQLELAHDYLKAGLLDRAEALLKGLHQSGWSGEAGVVRSLLTVYEQEKEWQKAIDLLAGYTRDDALMSRAGHYYSELAEVSLQKSEWLRARQYISKSLSLNRQGVRALLQLGRLEYTLGNYREAAGALRRIAAKNPLFIPESLPLLEKCYAHMPGRRGLSAHLAYCFKHYPGIAVVAAMARHIEATRDESAAARFIAREVLNRPTLRGMEFLIQYHVRCAGVQADSGICLLREIAGKLVAARAVYRCADCGFDSKELHWRCPRCHVWGKSEPITGPDGQ